MCCMKYFTKAFLYYRQGSKSLKVSAYTEFTIEQYRRKKIGKKKFHSFSKNLLMIKLQYFPLFFFYY